MEEKQENCTFVYLGLLMSESRSGITFHLGHAMLGERGQGVI